MSDVAQMNDLVQKYKALKQEIEKVIVGQEEVVDQIICALFRGDMLYLLGYRAWQRPLWCKLWLNL